MSIVYRSCRCIFVILLIQLSFSSVGFSQSADVAMLLQNLQQGNAQQQSAAIRAIVEISDDEQRSAATTGLVKLLNSPNPGVRSRSAYTLGYLATGNVDVAKELIKLALDEEPQVRTAAIKALIKIKAPQALTMPIWVKTMQSSDAEAIMHVIQSMADLGADAIPALRGALKHPEAAYWALLVVSEIGPEAAVLTPELMELIDHAQPEVQLQAIIAMGKIKGDGRVIVPALIKVLRNDAPMAGKYAACFALSQYPDQSAGAVALEATLAEATDPELKLLAGWSLLTINPQTSLRAEALTAIIAGLSSDQPRIRQLAVTALSDIKPGPEGPSPMVIDAMMKALQDSDPEVIAQVVDGLAAKGKSALSVIKLGLGNETLLPWAVELARRLGPDAAPIVPELIKALELSGDAELTREIDFALAAIGPPAGDAGKSLIAQLDSENPRVRYSACYALGSIGADAAEVVPHLKKCLADDDPLLRLAAIWSLLKIQPNDAEIVSQAMPLLIEALAHENEYVRLEAARTLGALGEEARPSLDQLKALADDESGMVRQAAADAVLAIQSN